MSTLFQSTPLKSLTLRNRFVRSATWTGTADENGSCTPEQTRMMTDLARGEVGLIITGHAYVEKRGQASVRQLGIHDEHVLPELEKMVAAVHAAGGKIALQLAHAGIAADPKLTFNPPRALSVIAPFMEQSPDEMTESDLGRIVEAFALSARRAVSVGFDAVQIHAAHGYLLSQSLSPFFNKRSDRYGGDLENRATLLDETVRAVRGAVGPACPLLVKMNTGDHLDGGLETAEAVVVATRLQEAGVDAIELSGGTGLSGKLNPVRSGISAPDDEAYFKPAARQFREALRLPLILVGGIRSFEIAESIVTEGVADFVALCRPLIREPALVSRWASGDRRKSRCLSDNRCFVPARTGKGLHCVQEKRKNAMR